VRENTVPAEKTSRIRRIISQMNKAIFNAILFIYDLIIDGKWAARRGLY
jgi:hypothetical protein